MKSMNIVGCTGKTDFFDRFFIRFESCFCMINGTTKDFRLQTPKTLVLESCEVVKSPETFEIFLVGERHFVLGIPNSRTCDRVFGNDFLP